jgi:Ser-tRNA(Ala) deacylase AlaX
MASIPPYWTKPLKSEFPVIVKECNKEDDYYEIILSEDVIRPAGGGQAGDRGFLQSGNQIAKIHDTVMKDNQTTLIVDTFLQAGTECIIIQLSIS